MKSYCGGERNGQYTLAAAILSMSSYTLVILWIYLWP